ncbi:glycolate oxidase subunit GlcF [Fuscibacter oryzae]|uniref:Glycolate oxidase iron-sulfur subunit n=1 Tax=Fuscibacter oryzae TaxID=2803939 RepID=A0A8J7STR8_9RHOB|nr:glycolate oxidase subunit GlcF [Fuscibacter oryzae]MBL4928850.1 glycolate oxidase subunit GlcF [Fuscibacter oryzae]
MQTHFTPEQLTDPGLKRANEILRACVHCGFCTATCPSYQVLGDELDSPRGRIYLIKEMLETGRPADEKTVKHIDRCLSCLACMTTCPSGVHYMHLIDHARAHVEQTYRRPLTDRMLRWVLAKVLPYPGRFRLALLGAKMARPFARFLPDARLRAMVAMAPKTVPAVSRNDNPQTFPANGERRFRVALMTGCAQKALNTDINDATIRLLRRLGCEVVIPPGMGCCGALTHHMGREDEAHEFAGANIRAFLAEKAKGLDFIVINTSGCGTTVKDYGHMLRSTPLAAQAAEVAGLAKDISEVLVKIGLPPGTPKGLRVAYHAACSLQHGQQVKTAPKDLLKRVGFEVVEPADSHLCCGSAGTYNLLQPEISAELKRRKVATLEAKAPDLIAAGNIGCMMQIGSGTGVPVVHTVELLDWATGGPRPRALSSLPQTGVAG